MEHHRYCLAGLRVQNDLGTADFGVLARGKWREPLTSELCERYSPPSTKTQQLVCCRHRAKAPVECIYEIGHRSSANRSLGNYGADGRECILHSVVQLGEQYALALLRA